MAANASDEKMISEFMVFKMHNQSYSPYDPEERKKVIARYGTRGVLELIRLHCLPEDFNHIDLVIKSTSDTTSDHSSAESD